MAFVLLEIVIPLLLAFALGLLVGFLVWRWRRRLLGASEWNALSKAATQANADLAVAEAANVELTNEASMYGSRTKASEKQVARLEAKVERLNHRIAELEAEQPK